jgi:metal-responsive CopG/Arc/MetJ family transcriptional regulator
MDKKRGRPKKNRLSANITLPADLHEATKKDRSETVEKALRKYLQEIQQ